MARRIIVLATALLGKINQQLVKLLLGKQAQVLVTNSQN
tara:strand:+ start:879 stop:995 length:117 start_codon:yes stop_codon:yes gene_type:complete